MKLGIQLFILFFLSLTCYSQEIKSEITINILEGEYWWAGISSRGYEMPYDDSSVVTYDLWGNNHGNQAQPLLISNR